MPKDRRAERQRHDERHAERDAQPLDRIPRSPAATALDHGKRRDDEPDDDCGRRVNEKRQAEHRPAGDRPRERRLWLPRTIRGGHREVQEGLAEVFGREVRRVGRGVIKRKAGANDEDERRGGGQRGAAVDEQGDEHEQGDRRREIDVRAGTRDDQGRGRPRDARDERHQPRGHRVVPHVLVQIRRVGAVSLVEDRLRGRQLSKLDVGAGPGQVAHDGPVLAERDRDEHRRGREHDDRRRRAKPDRGRPRTRFGVDVDSRV